MIDRKILTDEEHIFFCIAGHTIDVEIPDTLDLERLLPSFRPFRCNMSEERKAMCSIRIVEQPIDSELGSTEVLTEISELLGYKFCLMETKQYYIIDVQYVKGGKQYRMVTDKTFSTATAYVDRNEKYAENVLSLFLMINFAQSAVLHKTLLIHASVVEKEQKGYVFLGKSGTGKSTHSQLWLRYIEGTDLLNDDNPAIRIEEDGNVYVYGTPWSGKTPCYKNHRRLLKAMIRLEQAPVNCFAWETGIKALISLLPSCLSMRWSTLLYTEMCNLLEEIIANVKMGYLKCLPDKEAALLCYEEVEEL